MADNEEKKIVWIHLEKRKVRFVTKREVQGKNGGGPLSCRDSSSVREPFIFFILWWQKLPGWLQLLGTADSGIRAGNQNQKIKYWLLSLNVTWSPIYFSGYFSSHLHKPCNLSSILFTFRHAKLLICLVHSSSLCGKSGKDHYCCIMFHEMSERICI